jgi:hypothetical protein
MPRAAATGAARAEKTYRDILGRKGPRSDTLYVNMLNDELPDLRGKVVAIYFVYRTEPRDVAIVEDAHFELQGGRLFLAGRVPSGINPGDWNAGLTTCIAWDAVAEYTVFDSISDFRERAGRVPPGTVH